MIEIMKASELFHVKCTARLLAKEKDGWTGWKDPEQITDNELIDRAVANIYSGDFADAANLAMMLDFRGARK